MKKYIYLLLTSISQICSGQLSYPIANFYGYCWLNGSQTSAIVSSSTLSTNCTLKYNRTLTIAKKGSGVLTFDLGVNYVSSNSSYCIPWGTPYTYYEVSNTSIISSSYPYSSGGISLGHSSNNTSWTYASTTAQNDFSYLLSCASNFYIRTWVVSGVTWAAPAIDLKKSVEYNVDVKNWALGYSTNNSGNWYIPMLKYIQTNKVIVTDPKNWTTYSCSDYDYNGSTSSNPSSKTTNDYLMWRYSSGTFNPMTLLNNLPHSSIADSIFKVEIHSWNGSSWTVLGGSANYKSGISYPSIPVGNLVLRYYYRLADDPATTSGVKSGFLDITGVAGVPVGASCIGVSTNPLMICKDGSNLDLMNLIDNPSSVSHCFVLVPNSYLRTQNRVNFTGSTSLSGAQGQLFLGIAPLGTYTVYCNMIFDNGTYSTPVVIKSTPSPLVHNSTNFKYGDGSIAGSSGVSLDICQGDNSKNSITFENLFLEFGD